MNTLEMKLKNSVREIDNCIKKTHMNNISQPVATSILAGTPASTQNNPEAYMSSGSGHILNDFSIQTTPTQMSQMTQHFTPTPVTCNNPSNTQIYENYSKNTQAILNQKRQADYGDKYCLSPLKKKCQPCNGASAFRGWHRPPQHLSMQQGKFSAQNYPVSKPLTCNYSLDSSQQPQSAILQVKPEYFSAYDQFNIKPKTSNPLHSGELN